MEALNIGYDAKRYFNNFTGLGNYSRSLIHNYLRYFTDDQLFLYSPNVNSNQILPYAPYNIRTPSPGTGKMFGSLWRTFSVPDQLEEDNLDIYHGLSNELPVGLSRKKSIKSIVTIHDLIFLRFPNFYHRSELLIYKQKFKHACKTADHIITISDQTKQDIVQFFNIPESKIETVYQSCNSIFYKMSEEAERIAIARKYNLPQHYLLFVGTINERKNAGMIVDALKILDPQLKPPLILIGGGKAYKKAVKEKIESNRLTKQVRFLSGVPDEDLPALYQMASAFIYPSFYEGFGIPIIEALHSGTPVIAAKTSCLPEAGGPSSLYIDPTKPDDLADAIQRVLEDSALAKRMIEDGMKYVAQFHESATSERLNRFYHSIIP